MPISCTAPGTGSSSATIRSISASDDLQDSAEARAELREFIRSNPHVTTLSEVFCIAGVDFGRADYGIVGDRVQVYEINTNPKGRIVLSSRLEDDAVGNIFEREQRDIGEDAVRRIREGQLKGRRNGRGLRCKIEPANGRTDRRIWRSGKSGGLVRSGEDADALPRR